MDDDLARRNVTVKSLNNVKLIFLSSQIIFPINYLI